MKRPILILLLLIPALGCFASPLEEVRTQVRKEYLDIPSAADVSALAAAMDGEGKWPDVDYSDTSTSLWQLEKHLDRIVDMARVLGQAPDGNQALADAVMKGLNQWFDGNYVNSNWWYTKIGVPRRMLALAYLLDGLVSDEIKEKIDRSLDVIDSDDYPARPGGDRIQVLSNHAKVLLWRRDYDGAAGIFRKIEDEARIAPFEDTMYDAGGGLAVRNAWRPSGRGVQPDMSFHHRGDRVDSTLSYGLELPEFFIYWARLLKHTEWAFSPSAVDFIIDYYLDGVSRHLVAGRYAEPSIMNRELSRPVAGVMTPELAEGLMEICNGYRQAELEDALKVVRGEKDFDGAYAANFFESGYFAFARPAFQTAVRYHSERNSNQEAPHNREGIRNHFRGDGACMLSVTGREYSDIAPVFDFRMVPGVTAPLLPYDSLQVWGEVQVLDPPAMFAAAVADSLYGAVAFDFSSTRQPLKARKGYFFFDDEYLCLGAGISSTSPYEIVTTIEQCLSRSGDVAADSGWYFHNGNAYHVISGEAEASVESRAGTWGNAAENVEYENTPVEADVFTLTICHGIGPGNSGYAYAVCPAVSEKRDHTFEILANDPTMQAVASKDGNLIYVIFYEPGSIETSYGTFSSPEPCILMIHEGKETIYRNS